MYTLEQLKSFNNDDWNYAVKLIVQMSCMLESEVESEESPIYDVPLKDFQRSQEDMVLTFFDNLDDLEIDYSDEIVLAETFLMDICNKLNILIEEEAQKYINFYYLLVNSIYQTGTGLWEIEEHKTLEVPLKEYLDVYSLLIKIGEKYDYDNTLFIN